MSGKRIVPARVAEIKVVRRKRSIHRGKVGSEAIAPNKRARGIKNGQKAKHVIATMFAFWDNPEDDIYEKFYEEQKKK